VRLWKRLSYIAEKLFQRGVIQQPNISWSEFNGSKNSSFQVGESGGAMSPSALDSQ
jgi:hypothetical protein